MSATQSTAATTLARQHWNADRAKLRISAPWWPMPAWSRAPAWRRRPYVLAAAYGRHPDDGRDQVGCEGRGA